MKRIFTWFLVLLLVLAIGGAFLYLYKKSQAKPVVYQTEIAEVTDITKKTVATGSIVPRQQVEVKPKVTGVLSELYVEPGKIVKQGDPLGKISIIPDAMQINQAESGVRTSQIALRQRQARARSQRGAVQARRDRRRRAAEVPDRVRAAQAGARDRRLEPAARQGRRDPRPGHDVDADRHRDGRRHGDRRAGQGRLLGDPGQQLQPRHDDRDDRGHERHDLRRSASTRPRSRRSRRA